MDNDRSGAGLGLPVMVALVGGLLERHTRGSIIIVGSLNLGGSVEMIPNPVAIAELAVEKGAKNLLMPVAARRALNDLPDELAAKISAGYYIDSEDAVFKCLDEWALRLEYNPWIDMGSAKGISPQGALSLKLFCASFCYALGPLWLFRLPLKTSRGLRWSFSWSGASSPLPASTG